MEENKKEGGYTKAKTKTERMYDKYSLPLEESFSKKIYKVLIKQAKRLENDFRHVRKQTKQNEREKAEKYVVEMTEWEKEEEILFDVFAIEYLKIAEKGNELTNILFFEKEKQTLFSIIKDDVLEWINGYGGKQIKRITETTRVNCIDIIQKGLIDGDATSVIAENIKNKLGDLSLFRSKVIAETEIHNTFMHSRELNFKEAKIKKWRWVTSEDEKVRPTHIAVSGQVREIGKKFSNGLTRPGDPQGPAREVVRCRCDLEPVL